LRRDWSDVANRKLNVWSHGATPAVGRRLSLPQVRASGRGNNPGAQAVWLGDITGDGLLPAEAYRKTANTSIPPSMLIKATMASSTPHAMARSMPPGRQTTFRSCPLASSSRRSHSPDVGPGQIDNFKTRIS
jgi:hypothetical protein